MPPHDRRATGNSRPRTAGAHGYFEVTNAEFCQNFTMMYGRSIHAAPDRAVDVPCTVQGHAERKWLENSYHEYVRSPSTGLTSQLLTLYPW